MYLQALQPRQHLVIDTSMKIPQSRPEQIRRQSSYAENNSSWYECASYNDIKNAIATGVAPARILYTNPIASPAALRSAAKMGVHTVTVNSPDDVLKIKMYNPQARLVFRINAGDITTQPSALHFAVETANDLLEEAASYRLQVVTVNFYVATIDLAAFRRAIDSSPQMVEVALEVERKLELAGIGANLISSTCPANDLSPESPLAFSDFNDIQTAPNTLPLVS